MAQQSLANDLFADMGRKVAEASARGGDEDEKLVEEIESLCMNCHEQVCVPQINIMFILLTITGNYTITAHTYTLLPRNSHNVLRMPTLQLEKLRDPTRRRDPATWNQILPQARPTRRLESADRQERHCIIQGGRHRPRDTARPRTINERRGCIDNGFARPGVKAG